MFDRRGRGKSKEREKKVGVVGREKIELLGAVDSFFNTRRRGGTGSLYMASKEGIKIHGGKPLCHLESFPRGRNRGAALLGFRGEESLV